MQTLARHVIYTGALISLSSDSDWGQQHSYIITPCEQEKCLGRQTHDQNSIHSSSKTFLFLSSVSYQRDDFRACFELHKKNKSASAQFLPLPLCGSAHRSTYVFICTCIHTFRQCDPERERERGKTLTDSCASGSFIYRASSAWQRPKCFINS
jgi:hypothetical protein